MVGRLPPQVGWCCEAGVAALLHGGRPGAPPFRRGRISAYTRSANWAEPMPVYSYGLLMAFLGTVSPVIDEPSDGNDRGFANGDASTLGPVMTLLTGGDFG